MLCFAAHLFYSIFQASGLRERERERERERHTDRDRETDTERCVCVCVSVLSAVDGQLNPRDGSIKLNIAPSSPQQPIKQNNTKPNISLPPKFFSKKTSTPTKNSKQNNFFPLTLTCRLSKTELHN